MTVTRVSRSRIYFDVLCLFVWVVVSFRFVWGGGGGGVVFGMVFVFDCCCRGGKFTFCFCFLFLFCFVLYLVGGLFALVLLCWWWRRCSGFFLSFSYFLCLTCKVHHTDGSAPIIVGAATLTQKLQIKLIASPSDGTLTSGQPILPLRPQHQAFSMVTTGVPCKTRMGSEPHTSCT